MSEPEKPERVIVCSGCHSYLGDGIEKVRPLTGHVCKWPERPTAEVVRLANLEARMAELEALTNRFRPLAPRLDGAVDGVEELIEKTQKLIDGLTKPGEQDKT